MLLLRPPTLGQQNLHRASHPFIGATLDGMLGPKPGWSPTGGHRQTPPRPQRRVDEEASKNEDYAAALGLRPQRRLEEEEEGQQEAAAAAAEEEPPAEVLRGFSPPPGSRGIRSSGGMVLKVDAKEKIRQEAQGMRRALGVLGKEFLPRLLVPEIEVVGQSGVIATELVCLDPTRPALGGSVGALLARGAASFAVEDIRCRQGH